MQNMVVSVTLTQFYHNCYNIWQETFILKNNHNLRADKWQVETRHFQCVLLSKSKWASNLWAIFKHLAFIYGFENCSIPDSKVYTSQYVISVGRFFRNILQTTILNSFHFHSSGMEARFRNASPLYE